VGSGRHEEEEALVRIKVIAPFPFGPEGLVNRENGIPPDQRTAGTEIVFVPVKNSPTWGDSAHDSLLDDFFEYEAGMKAEDEGFDVVCIDTVSDSGMNALRSRLNILVLGPGLVSFHIACILGKKFSIVTMWERWAYLYEKLLTEYQLWDHCASIRFPELETPPDVTNLLAGKEEVAFPALEEICWRCINEDGADTIVLGSTTMYQAAEYLKNRLPVPVINPVLVQYKMAELLFSLGLSHSKQVRAWMPPGVIKDQVFQAAADAVDVRGTDLWMRSEESLWSIKQSALRPPSIPARLPG
jgi:allantoin racemase